MHLTLHSPDVIHAFYVPQFLFKRDVVPGKENEFEFNVDPSLAGATFRGQCAELCGTFHDAMQFTVKAMTPADYTAWLQKSDRRHRSAATRRQPSARTAPFRAPAARPPSQRLTRRAGDQPDGRSHRPEHRLQQTKLTAKADVTFILNFTNNDAGIPHNVVIHRGPNGAIRRCSPARSSRRRLAAVPDPRTKAGTYAFSCKVHPNMTGTLTVQ